MFGGKDADEKYLNELWEWNGTTWSKLDTVNTLYGLSLTSDELDSELYRAFRRPRAPDARFCRADLVSARAT